MDIAVLSDESAWTLFLWQDVMDHLEVDIQGEGENQRVRVFGNGTMFPNIQVLLPRIGFIKREDEHDRYRFV